jgi:hypothetical protein
MQVGNQGEKLYWIIPHALRESQSATPQSRTSGLQNYETISLCCLGHLVCDTSL